MARNNNPDGKKNTDGQKNRNGNGHGKKGKNELSKAAYGLADALAHLLEDVLDKGLVVAGDVKVELEDLELVLKLRLIVTMIDKARDLGIDWWDQDRFYTTSEPTEFQKLKSSQAALEKQLAETTQRGKKSSKNKSKKSRKKK